MNIRKKLNYLRVMNIQVNTEDGFYYTDYETLKKYKREISKIWRRTVLSGEIQLVIGPTSWTLI